METPQQSESKIDLSQSAPFVVQAALIDGSLWFQLVSAQNKLTEPAVAKFKRLAAEWRRDTRFVSAVRRKVAHPAYLKIIGMGKDALPFILKDLDDRPADWIPALISITDENPAKADNTFEQAVKAWLKWGRDHDLL